MENKDDFIFRISEVLSVDDDQGGNRIKVRLSPYDNDISQDKDLPYCYPFMPKMLHIFPKKGEAVLIILQEQNAQKANRFFIGPIISQDYNLKKEFADSAQKLLAGKHSSKVFPNYDRNENNIGSLPSQDDIAIRGRDNSDLILKENEQILRCGFKKKNITGDASKNLEFNDIDPSYIQMKYKERTDEEDSKYSSSINVVSDRINLLSYDSKGSTSNFNLTDRNSFITDDEMKNILSKAHALPYGDLLIDFMNDFISIFKRHVHPFPGLPPALSSADTKKLSTNLSNYLSKAIKIN